jgi:hypothetical protein
MAEWRRTIAVSMLVLSVFGLGILAGITAERVRFDVRRTAVVQRYERLAAERRAQLMERELERADSAVTRPRRP